MPPYLHKRTSDASLVPFLNVYFQKLRGLWDRGTRFYRKQMPMEYWTADLRIDGEHLTVALDARDHFYFEFFTTGNPLVTTTVTQDGHTFDSVKAACVGVQVQCDRNGMQWRAAIREGKRSSDGRELSIVKRPFQVQLINEPVINPPPTTILLNRRKEWQFLYESFAPMHSHTGVHLRSYNKGVTTLYADPGFSRNAFGNDYIGDTTQTYDGVQLIRYDYAISALPLQPALASAHTLRDVFYDVPFISGFKAEAVKIGYLNNLTVDWPRANGVRTVDDPVYGKREFAICIDAFNQFSVFPTGKIQSALLSDTDQNVNATYVTTVAPTLPAWVYAPTGRFRDYYTAHSDTGLLAFPEYDWKVAPDGKHACAVVYERVAVSFDATYMGYPGVNPNGLSRFNAYLDQTGFYSRFGDTEAGFLTFAGDAQRYTAGTGLLEATIAITLTGPNAEDYTLDVTVAEVRRPTTSDYCTLLAGYVGQDIKGYATRGDMVVLDIERWYRPPANGTDLPRSLQGNEDSLYVLRNLTASTELNSFPGPDGGKLSTDGASYGGSLQDFDLSTLSFVFNGVRVVSSVVYTATIVHTLNQFREIFYPSTFTDAAQQAVFRTAATTRYRTTFGSEWIFYPYSYNPLWSDTADLGALREHLCWEMGFITRDHTTPWLDDPGTGGSTNPVNQPTYAQKAWFAGLRSLQPLYGLALTDTPQFSWYSYADSIVSAMAKTPWSTFFVHPSGTWAYFDQSRIYNRNAVGVNVASWDVTLLEHFIVDRVHFEYTMPDGRVLTKDLTFKDLYNAAVDDLPPEQIDFTHLTTANMSATFVKDTNPSPAFATGAALYSWLKLKATWDGVQYVFEDGGVNNAPINAFSGLPLPPLQGGYRTFNLSLDSFWTGISPMQAHQHRTFSSCLLIQ